MKALAVFPQDRRFGVIDHPEPALKSPHEVMIRMLEVGICGTDKEIVGFQYGEPPEGSNYLVLGHESLGEVVEMGSNVTHLKRGDLAVVTVRRPCGIPSCTACAAGRQDFCFTGDYTERGIMKRHGYMTEFVCEEARYVNPVPRALRDVAVLVEPLTIAEKGVEQLWEIQRRLPWAATDENGKPSGRGRNALVLGAGPVGILGTMKLILEGFETTVYSRVPPASDVSGLLRSIGARFVDAASTDVPTLAKQMGTIDMVYEATGVSSLAFQVMEYLGVNGAFVLTGVPGHKPPVGVDTDKLMRDRVLKNQVVFGTVNASVENFRNAISDIGAFAERWPRALGEIITHRVPLQDATEPLSGKIGGIKNVVAVAS